MRNGHARMRRLGIASGLCLLIAGFIAGYAAWLRSSGRGLPYRDEFSSGKAEEWKAFGGTWELAKGMMRNESDERGAKLLTGSPYWHNYSVESDVYLLGPSGDAGLIIRSGNEEDGVNAYRGYYAGVRTFDNSMVLGRADHGWMEVPKRGPIPGGIRPFQWYHLRLMAVDCQIAVSVSEINSSAQTALEVRDSQCFPAGRIGLRSYSSGGIWRNVVVRPARQQDLVDMMQAGKNHTSVATDGVATVPETPASQPLAEQEQEAQEEQSIAGVSTQSIGSLRLGSLAAPANATVRGVVVLTAPRLYVEDASGGIYIERYSGPLLKVGDEVEISGDVYPGSFSSRIDNARVKVLWARSPMPPLSVTAAQASSGRYDATFVELRGVLTAKERGSNNSLILDLDDGPQSFRAVLNPGRSDVLFSRLKVNSSLRLRGICVVDSTLTQNLTPFVLLLRSNEDLDIVAGPPWWSTRHILALIVAAGLVVLGSVVLYHRVENWRLRAILEERGRLAHEMHDTLAQSFAGIGFQLQAIQNGLPQGMPALSGQLDLARELVRHSHEEARRSIATLRTEPLDSEDIVGALEECARSMVRGTHVAVVTDSQGDQREIPLRMTDTLFRIGQEAIANAVRHANPSSLTVGLSWSSTHVSLRIEDDGVGFVPRSGLSGFGIRGMRRRAQSVSAVLEINSRPGAGTQVRVEAPLPPRVTLKRWPYILWRHTMGYRTNARPSRAADSNLYRG
ncbi:MAG TPA: histidine kinase [Acidobacteriaceae bacterium]|nr:histidine kinase [Acidobacteriaceae bacterium]